MNDLFPADRLRQFLMAVFIVLSVIELSRASYIWGVVDLIFAASFSPRIKIWALTQWYRFFRK